MSDESLGKVKLEGFTEFDRDTATIKKNLPDDLRDSSVDIARDILAAAQSNAGAPQQALAASTLTMTTDGEGATISSDLIWFGGAEYGGQGRPQTMQFPPYNNGRGFFLGPAVEDNDDAHMQRWDEGVQRAMTPWDRRG